MSSMYPLNSPLPSHCIDGVTTYTGCCGLDCHPYLCLTDNTEPDGGLHWLVISVTGYSVDKIVVYNRVITNSVVGCWECCDTSMNGAQLIYSNDLAGNDVIYQSTFGYTSSVVYTFELPLK